MTDSLVIQWLYRTAVGMTMGLLLVSIVYTTIRINNLSRLGQELSRVQGEIDIIRMRHESMISDANSRLDSIERVLYGDVVAKLQKVPQATRLEVWQQNREKELRERINQLERWRNRHDAAEREK